MIETFKPINGFDGYFVSNLGRVKSVRQGKERILKGIPLKRKSCSYHSVILRKDGKNHRHYIHTLVLETFVGKRPKGLVCRHKDNDVTNNCVTNLCWGTQKENMNDAIKNGSHSCIAQRKLTPEMITTILTTKTSCRKLAQQFGCSHLTIWAVRKGKRYTLT
jgi:formate dehydrogenase assembly factor FdhD